MKKLLFSNSIGLLIIDGDLRFMPPQDASMPEGERRQTVTRLLHRLREDDADVLDRLMPLVYDELREMAHHKLRFERADHTLNTTALVHEAYLKLVDQRQANWQSRTHFFAIAARVMRRILVDYARRRQAQKRGGQRTRVSIQRALDEAAFMFSEERAAALLALDQALDQLATFNERGCQVVEYRVFGGLTHAEVANVMGLSPITVRRAWTTAKTWLRRELLGS